MCKIDDIVRLQIHIAGTPYVLEIFQSHPVRAQLDQLFGGRL
jgi:hypothetical protein